MLEKCFFLRQKRIFLKNNFPLFKHSFFQKVFLQQQMSAAVRTDWRFSKKHKQKTTATNGWSVFDCCCDPCPIQNDNSNRAFGILRGSRRKFRKKFENVSNAFCTNRSFVPLLVRSKIFQILVRADAIDLVQKSSNFEPSSRFVGRLRIFWIERPAEH